RRLWTRNAHVVHGISRRTSVYPFVAALALPHLPVLSFPTRRSSDLIQFKFPYGTSGHLFEWYHNQNDPQNIQMAFLIKEGAEDPHGIILYKDSIYKDESNEELSEYFCVTSVSRVKR